VGKSFLNGFRWAVNVSAWVWFWASGAFSVLVFVPLKLQLNKTIVKNVIVKITLFIVFVLGIVLKTVSL
jgi:hypothetical protein